MNAKQAKAIVFVCGLILFAAAVINLSAGQWLAALAWAAVAALAGVLYKMTSLAEAQSRILAKGVLPMIKDFEELKQTLERGVKATLTVKPGKGATVSCDLTGDPDDDPDEDFNDNPDNEDNPAPFTAEEQEDAVMDTAACIIDNAGDFDEEQVYEREVAFTHNGKEYNARLTVELTRDPTDTPDTSEQGAVAE